MAGAWGAPQNSEGRLSTPGDGGDGGPTAIFDEEDWNALGSSDEARLAAFLLLNETGRRNAAFLYCEEGFGGLYDSQFSSPGGPRRMRSPSGPLAFIRDPSGAVGSPETIGQAYVGSSGAGGGDSLDDPTDSFGGGVGSGGAACAAGITDSIWSKLPYGLGGYMGRWAGNGGQAKGPYNDHGGSHGGLWGGGGSGASKQNEIDGTYPGGFGAPGVGVVIEKYGD